MVHGYFPLPDEIVLSILLFLDGNDVRSFGNTCRRFRKLITVNKGKLRKPELQWRRADLLFGCRISLSCHLRFPYKPLIHRKFTEDEFLRDFANIFFVITPDLMYIKCKDLDDRTAGIVRRCVGNMSGKALALEIDKCLDLRLLFATHAVLIRQCDTLRLYFSFDFHRKTCEARRISVDEVLLQRKEQLFDVTLDLVASQ